MDTDTALKVSQSVYCFITSIFHGVENYFPRLWGTGISDAIFIILIYIFSGLYVIEIKVTLKGLPLDVISYDTMYVEVLPTPLIVQIAGGIERLVSMEDNLLVVDGETLSVDPDVNDVGKLSKFQLVMYKLRFCTSCNFYRFTYTSCNLYRLWICTSRNLYKCHIL